MTRRLALLLALALLPSGALAAPAQDAEKNPGWTEYHRAYAEVRAYKVLGEEAGGVREVVVRTACLPEREDAWSCAAALEIYRKLSVLVMPSQVVFNPAPPEGEERPGVAERLSGYAIDCAGERYAPLSTEWRDARGKPVTRIEYPGRAWRPLEKIEGVGRQVCPPEEARRPEAGDGSRRR